jgi:prepilin-type N-terminal cleavage/methylation domain-containing protein
LETRSEESAQAPSRFVLGSVNLRHRITFVLRYSVASCGNRMPVFALKSSSLFFMKGLTLIEMLVALVIVGLLSGAAMPAIGGLRERYTVQAAAEAIAAAHTRARIRAILESRVTELEIRGDSLILRVAGGGTPAVVWSAAGPLASSVTLASPPRTLLFSPTGVTMGFANASFILTKGSARRQVIVSRLGRVRITP